MVTKSKSKYQSKGQLSSGLMLGIKFTASMALSLSQEMVQPNCKPGEFRQKLFGHVYKTNQELMSLSIVIICVHGYITRQ